MRKVIIFTFISLILITVFTLFLNYFSFIETKPDIILIMVIYIAIAFDESYDIFIAFILGYIFDVFSGSAVGLFTMLRIITFVIVRFINMNFFSKNTLFFVIITFIMSIFDSIYLGYQFITNGDGFLRIFSNAFYISFINAIVAFLMYPLLVKIEGLYLKTIKETKRGY